MPSNMVELTLEELEYLCSILMSRKYTVGSKGMSRELELSLKILPKIKQMIIDCCKNELNNVVEKATNSP